MLPAVAVAGMAGGGWRPPEAAMPGHGVRPEALEEEPAPERIHRLPAAAAPRRGATVRKLIRQGEMLMGYSLYNNAGFSKGMSRLDLAGHADFLWIDPYAAEYYQPTVGWLRDERLCCFMKYQIFEIEDYRYVEMDPYTGEILDEYKVPLYDEVTGFDNYLPLYISAAYNPDDGMIWGYSSNEGGSGYSFVQASAAAPGKPTAIVEKEDYSRVCASICYNPKDKSLYGVNRENNFVRIEADGSQTVLMPIGERTAYARAALMYVEDEDYFLWNCQLVDGTTGLWCIDPSTSQVAVIVDYQNEASLPILFFGKTDRDPKAIAAPVIDFVDFGMGQTDGRISFFIPTAKFDGTPIQGTLDWRVSVDDALYAQGSAEAGKKVTVDFSALERGEHTFSFAVSANGLESPEARKSVFVGYDTPLAPTDVALSDTEVTWTGITRGVDGGYLDMEGLVYHVYLNDEEIGVTHDCRLPLEADLSQLPYAGYSAKVTADNAGYISDESKASELMTVGLPWTPDLHIVPTESQMKAFAAYDANKDGYVWGMMYLDDEGACLKDPTCDGAGNDDWLFTPPIEISDITTDYELALDICNKSESYRNLSVSVKLCSAMDPDAVVKELIDYKPKDNDKAFNRVSQVFSIPEPGVYYLAFYVESGPYQMGIRMKDIEVKRTGTSVPRPDRVVNLIGVGAPKAELKANVEFTVPSQFLSGDAIPEGEEITVEVQSGVETVTLVGKPGEILACDIATEQGDNEVRVVPMYDGLPGHISTINIYCGYDIPGAVQSLTGSVSEDNLALHINWTPPTEVGENGYYVDPENVTYKIYLSTENGWTEIDEVDKDTRTYSFGVAPNNGLQSEWLGVVPVNEAGESPSMPYMSDMLGTPYAVPMKETFTDASLDCPPLRVIRITDLEGYTEWTMTNPKYVHDSFANESGVCLKGSTLEKETTGMLMLPKVSTAGLDAAHVRFNVWTGPGMAAIFILGEVYDQEGMIELGTVPIGEGWTDYEIDLPESMLDHQWIALYVMAYYPTTNYFTLISNYSVNAGVSDSGVGETLIDSAAEGISGGHGCIVLRCHAGEQVSVYAMDGYAVKSEKVTSDLHMLNMAKGMYVVNAGGKTAKVTVR